MAPLTSIRNIGPKMAAHFQNAGIKSAEEAYALGREECYRQLIAAGMTTHFMAYIALSAGLEGRHWNDHSQDEKAELRREHNALIAGKSDLSEMEKHLSALGLPK